MPLIVPKPTLFPSMKTLNLPLRFPVIKWPYLLHLFIWKHSQISTFLHCKPDDKHLLLHLAVLSLAISKRRSFIVNFYIRNIFARTRLTMTVLLLSLQDTFFRAGTVSLKKVYTKPLYSIVLTYVPVKAGPPTLVSLLCLNSYALIPGCARTSK